MVSKEHFKMSERWCFVVVTIALSTVVSVLKVPAVATEAPAAAASVPSSADPVSGSETREPVKHKLAFKFQPNQIVRYKVSQESETTTHVKDDTETAKNSSQR